MGAAERAVWRTQTCSASIPYVLATNWYAHDLFRLRILDYFDWFFTLDDDVRILQKLSSREFERCTALLGVHIALAHA
jgi:hypothetical protein